jgi:sugar-specific transcriptional regulator TrmB
MNNIQLSLQNIGLSEMETAVYIAALELGEGTMQELAQKSQVKRATIYTFIEKLKKSGLILQTKRKKRTLYIAAHPNMLMEIQKRKIASME